MNPLRPILLSLLLSWPAAALAECPKIVLSKHLTERLALSHSVWGGPAFGTAVNEAEELLSCVRTKVNRSLAADYHRHFGLRAFAAGDTDRAELEFATGKNLKPDLELGDFVPKNDPVRALFASASLKEVIAQQGEPSAPPEDFGTILKVLDEDGAITYDGTPLPSRPPGQPVIVQILNNNGVVQLTAYLTPGQPLPRYGEPEPAVATADPAEADPVEASTDTPDVVPDEPKESTDEPKEPTDEADPDDFEIDGVEPTDGTTDTPLDRPDPTDETGDTGNTDLLDGDEGDDVPTDGSVAIVTPRPADDDPGFKPMVLPLLGGGVVAAVGGAWSGIAYGSTMRAYNEGTSATNWAAYLEAEERYNKGRASLKTAVTVTGVGAGFAVVGATGLVIDRFTNATVAPTIVPGGAGIRVQLGGKR